MPKKPIQPDRVRTPPQWRRARLMLMGAVGLMLTYVIIAIAGTIWWGGFRLDYWWWIASLAAVTGVFLWSDYFVRRVWKKRIIEHDGLMCPQCAYPLAGCPEKENSITCPECGYITDDTRELFERWRTTWQRFFWVYDVQERELWNRRPGP